MTDDIYRSLNLYDIIRDGKNEAEKSMFSSKTVLYELISLFQYFVNNCWDATVAIASIVFWWFDADWFWSIFSDWDEVDYSVCWNADNCTSDIEILGANRGAAKNVVTGINRDVVTSVDKSVDAVPDGLKISKGALTNKGRDVVTDVNKDVVTDADKNVQTIVDDFEIFDGIDWGLEISERVDEKKFWCCYIDWNFFLNVFVNVITIEMFCCI